jgi:hypothetical protein
LPNQIFSFITKVKTEFIYIYDTTTKVKTESIYFYDTYVTVMLIVAGSFVIQTLKPSRMTSLDKKFTKLVLFKLTLLMMKLFVRLCAYVPNYEK